MDHTYMRGPLSRERHRKAAKLASYKMHLLAAICFLFLLGAMYTDHQFYIAYGY